MAANFRKSDLILFNLGLHLGFANIYKANWGQLFNFLQKWLRNKELASEICEDCFVKLWELKGQFSSCEKINAFLFRVARNAAIDQLRKKKKNTLCDPLQVESFVLNELCELETTDLRNVIANRLDDLFLKLSPRAREIVKLSYFGEFRNCEIAAILGIKEQTVANIKERAIKKLRLHLSTHQSLAKTLRALVIELANIQT